MFIQKLQSRKTLNTFGSLFSYVLQLISPMNMHSLMETRERSHHFTSLNEPVPDNIRSRKECVEVLHTHLLICCVLQA